MKGNKMNELFEVYAISEEGTETVSTHDSRGEATREMMKLLGDLHQKRWENNTSLNNVVGFKIDTGPENNGRE